MTQALRSRLAKLEDRFAVTLLSDLSDQEFAARTLHLLEKGLAATDDEEVSVAVQQAVRAFASANRIPAADTAPVDELWPELRFELECQATGLAPAWKEDLDVRVRAMRQRGAVLP
jgi:hypothetical protein